MNLVRKHFNNFSGCMEWDSKMLYFMSGSEIIQYIIDNELLY